MLHLTFATLAVGAPCAVATMGSLWRRSPATPAAPERAERDLLARLQAGDEAAFEQLVRVHSGRMLAVAKRLLRNEDDAHDALQEAFLAAFRALPQFQGDSQLSTWLHRIVVNAALMKLRTRARRPQVSIEELLPAFTEDGHHADPPDPWQESASELAERAEMCDFVRRSIDALPENYRAVLLLRDILGMDTEEAARAMELTPNAVKVRLHRARQALRTLIDRKRKEVRP